jgi:hypothetical protein
MSKYQFLPLKDEKEFETLVNDLCSEKYGIEFQIYGRKGQKQNGIDGLSFSESQKQIVYQCKNKLINRDDEKIRAELLKDLEEEVLSASGAFTNIDTFIFANPFKQDTILQDKAAKLIGQYGFTIIVWSWEEIEGLLEKHLKIAKQYYPRIFDKSILSEQEIKQKFQENSTALFSSASLYIENSFIEMPEIDRIFEFINSDNYEDRLLVVTGKAGIGKTAILSKLQSYLTENNTAYLSIKSDKFDVENKDSFSRFFGVENILHSVKQVARKENVVILIDQLDALSLTMSSNQKTINIVLEFMEQLRRIPNIKIVASIREYDLNNDPLFKSLNDSNIVNIQLLSFEYVSLKLKSFIKESEKLNGALIELLRTPLHLSIFMELYPGDSSCISIKTLQDLYGKFWEQKVNSRLVSEPVRRKTITLLNSIVQKMNEIKKIEVPVLYFEDDFVEELGLLLSNGILKQENKKISFFHQTFYDYVFARDFAKSGMSLFGHIQTTHQDLSIREQFKQIIQFLRGVDEDKYLSELENILYSDKIRFHIKLLLVSYLGSLENPTDKEFTFIQKLFGNDKNFEKYFIESWISSDWLRYFKEANFFNNENFEKYRLHYRLETFVNKEPRLVFEILDGSYFDLNAKNEAIMLSLERLDNWSEFSFDIFQKYHHLIYLDNTRFATDKLYKKVFSYRQEYAINLFFDFLNSRIEKIDDYRQDEFLDHDWYEIFDFLLETNNKIVFQKLLELIQIISKKFKLEYSKKEFLITDQIFGSSMWQFDDLHRSAWGIYRKTLQKISELAKNDKDIFLELIKPYRHTRYLSLIVFLIFGYSQNPKEYKNEIFELFTNVGLLEELSFEQDDGYEFALLLEASFGTYGEAEQEKIFNSIIQVSPALEKTAFFGKWDKKPVYRGTYNGLQKYKLLCQLDIEAIRKFAYLKEFQELQRKFYWYKLEKPHKSKVSWVGAPLGEDVYKKMSLKNWLQSIGVFDGTNTREGASGFSRGGKLEHHRQFEKEITENPEKFYDFLAQLKSHNVHPDYLSAGLNGLIAANYDSKKILHIIHLYADIDDSWLKRTILKAIKYLISKDGFDVSVVDFLEANKNISYEGIIRDKDKFQTIHEHMSSAINSFEGDFAELLPLVYKHIGKDDDNKRRVLTLIEEVIEKNVDFVIFGLLRTLGSIDSVDKDLFARIMIDVVKKDNTGQVSISSLQNFHYLYVNRLVSKEQLVEFIEKCLSFVKLVKDKEDSHYIQNLGMFLFYYCLHEDDEIFEGMLNDAISSSPHVAGGVSHQIFAEELRSKDDKKVEKSKEFILRLKNSEDNESFYYYDLTKMNGFGFIQNDFAFIKNLTKSIHIRRDVGDFIKYLQNEYYLDATISDRIFQLIGILIENIDSYKVAGYYHSKPVIDFILELNSRIKSDKNKIELLNLIDKFLMSDTLRYDTKTAID